MLSSSVHERFLRGIAFIARVGKTCAHHDRCLHAALREIIYGRDATVGPEGEDSKVNGAWHIGDASKTFQSVDLVSLGIHGENRAVETACDKPANDLRPNLVAPSTRPNDHDRRRVKQQRHGCGLGTTYAIAARLIGGSRRNRAP